MHCFGSGPATWMMLSLPTRSLFTSTLYQNRDTCSDFSANLPGSRSKTMRQWPAERQRAIRQFSALRSDDGTLDDGNSAWAIHLCQTDVNARWRQHGRRPPADTSPIETACRFLCRCRRLRPSTAHETPRVCCWRRLRQQLWSACCSALSPECLGL